MKTRYRIKEARNEYGIFFYIQRKTLFGFWLNQFGEKFRLRIDAEDFLKRRLNRMVIVHEVKMN